MGIERLWCDALLPPLAKVRRRFDVDVIGRCRTGVGKMLDVHFDRHAADADAVFFLSRIKPHPGFVARHESGICKMLAIGCGKHVAALTCHRLGYAHFPELMVRMAQVVIDRLPGIVGSLAIVENALHDTALVECVPREQLIRRVREAVGPDVHLMVDAHGRFDLPQARRLAQRFEEFDLYFMEEPLPPENLDAWVELKRSTRTPIATGERYVARFQFRELLEKYCCDYIQPDAIYTGGMNELRKIAAMAEAYYCPVVPHNCNGPVCTAASIHAAACMPNFRMLEYIPVPEREDVLVEPLVMRDGAFALPTKPGLGVELNKAVFDRYVYQPRDLDHFTPVREIVL